MSYNTQQDILDFVEDNNVKFVRFAFCDIFGTQKNIAVLASDLPKAMEDGVCFDGSSIAGFMKVEESDLVLRPDLSTEAAGLGLERLPSTLEEAVQAAQESEFLHCVLPEELSHRYYEEELKRCAALKAAADPAEYERVHYFNAI